MTHFSIVRQKNGITQKKLSELSGVSLRTISRIEAGYVPMPRTVEALQRFIPELKYSNLLKDVK